MDLLNDRVIFEYFMCGISLIYVFFFFFKYGFTGQIILLHLENIFIPFYLLKIVISGI